MTVILAKLQALLFQSGIGLKIVSLHSNKHQATKEVHIATGEFSEFNLGGITECYNTLTDSSQRGKTSDCLLNIWRMLRCEVWGVRCYGDGGLLTTDTLRACSHHCQSALMDQTGLFHSSWALPVSLSHPSVTPTTYNLLPTAYSLRLASLWQHLRKSGGFCW